MAPTADLRRLLPVQGRKTRPPDTRRRDQLAPATRAAVRLCVPPLYYHRTTYNHVRLPVFTSVPRGPALRCVLACTCGHKALTKSRFIFSRLTENGPAFLQSPRVLPRSQEKCRPSSARHTCQAVRFPSVSRAFHVRVQMLGSTRTTDRRVSHPRGG